MRETFKILLILLIGVLSGYSGLAQGALCSDIEPFCAGDERLTFPNSNFTNSNQLNGELGPDYGCLDEQPYPAWFFLQIEEAGDLTFRISQFENSNGTGAPLDVDFVVWGPFERGDEYCNSSALSADKIVDCSYLPDAVETMSIPGAEANSIYVVVITNFEQLPGFISLEQTNAGQGGSTDCSILQLDLGDSISVCDESEYILDGTNDEASSYEWFIFNEASQEYEVIPGEDGPTLTVTTSGNYKLIVTDEIEGKSEEDDVTVTFYNSPEIGEVSSLAVCDLESEIIDLTESYNDLIQPNDGEDYEVLYYESSADVTDGNFISQPEIYPFEDGKTIFAEVLDMQSGCTSPVVDFELNIFDFPDLALDENTIFCVDQNRILQNAVEVGEDLGEEYSYEWYVDDTFISSEPVIRFEDLPSGSLLTAEVTHAKSGCQVAFSTLITPVSAPEIVQIDISGSDFGDGYTVTALPENYIGDEFAEFEFRLDDGAWQVSNVFSQVTPGTHRVTVREINGCGATNSEDFFLVGYPRFFTPNSDGYNDNWNLITDSNISIKTLYVFDRYGKLITRLDPDNKGWDGTYNGQDLPADDYWFRVEFIDEKTGRHQEYMSNFTLMRSR